MNHLRDLIREIHRRSLWQVLGVYLLASWVVLQFVDTLAGALNLPSWFPSLALALLVVGLPVVLATAFVQEGRPEAGRYRGEPIEGLEELGRDDGGDASAPPLSPQTGPTRFLTWRNAILGGTGALVLWATAAGSWVVLGDGGVSWPEETPGTPASTLIAVLPFSVQGAADLTYLGDGMVDLLSTALDGAGAVRAVDPFGLLAHVGGARDASPSPEAGRSVAGRFGASHYVMGSVFEAGGRLRLRASLYSSDGQLLTDAEARVPGESEVYDAVDELAKELLTAAGAGSGRGPTQLGSVTSASLPALKAYLDGVHAFRAGEWSRAIEPLQRAVALDSTFALAWLRLGMAASWTYADSLARDGVERSLRLSAGLPERERRLIAATHAFVTGDSREAARLYRQILTSHPDDVEATHMLGEIQWHFNPLHGLPMTDSRKTFERLLRLDPDNHEAVVHLRHDAMFEGRVEAYDSLARLHLERFPDADEAPVTRAERAFVVGDEEERRHALERLETVEDPFVVLSVLAVGMMTQEPGAAARVAGLLVEPDRSAATRAGGHVLSAYLEAGRGRWARAFDELRAAGAIDPATALEHRAFLTVLPSREPSSAELEELRGDLERWDPGARPPTAGATAFFWHQGLHPHLRLYLLGLVSGGLGNEAGALRLAEELEETPSPPEAGSLAGDLAAGVRAYAAWRAGRPLEALERLQGLRMQVSWPRMHFSPFHGRLLERHLRGLALAELGRDEEAVRWLSPEFSNPYRFAVLGSGGRATFR